ncbi:SAM-dependent methyltransferase [Streptomyces zagrosensis]|uniref:Cyclopropane fatty-acyl-phospholipid synthase-like methyltransferase n=1 Tax=Streptomyces zagrosensis TaxID=1042984 RepID=A0A7W9QED8_9ACTN|nr:methyltransferase domain-containing protein [Streptomyces zagrosensis]MBB5938705.1 cyclopropane fatty-acyl-phospholipid synthase-like methyltransferase [Streptomyces zagrosensis]
MADHDAPCDTETPNNTPTTAAQTPANTANTDRTTTNVAETPATAAEAPTTEAPVAPTPDEVGAMYDEFGDMIAMTLGGAAVHVGMFVPHDVPTRMTSLVDLSDLAQERQTDFLIDTLAPSSDANLLDIGCGTGGPALRLAQRSGARVTAVTVSRSQLDQCHERARAAGLGERVTFTRGNAMDLTYADATFDAAWSIDCFAHLSDRPAGLREARRVIRPGGHLLLTEFFQRGTPGAKEVAAFSQLWASPPPTTFNTLLAEVQDAGLEVLKVQNMTANMVLTSEVMGIVYQDRRAEIEERYGKEMTARTDLLMDPYRRFCRDFMEYHLLLLRTPEQ